MNGTPTSIDSLGAIIALIIAVVSGFTLLGTGVLMAIGAVFSKRPLVTSWPNEQEHSFAPFEQRSASASATAWVFGIAGAALVTFLAVGLYFGVAPEHHDMTKDMNMSNLTKRRTTVTAPRSDTAAPAPDTAAPAEAAPKAEPAKTETSGEAPKP